MNTFKQTILPIKTATFAGQEPELYIRTYGIFDSTGDFNWEQISSNICLHAIKAGCGTMEVNGKKYDKVKQGDIFIFWPNDHLKYYDYPDTPWHYEWFQCSGTKVELILNLCGLSRQNPHIPLGSNIHFWQTLEHLKNTLQQDNYSSLFSISSAWEILHILEQHLAQDKPAKEAIFLAEKCKQIIDNQLNYTPSINELAEQCQVNRTTLFRTFKKHYGMSPKDYINNQRFTRACQLLKQTRLSIKEIAYICGFEEQYYFSNAFRKKFDTSPSQFRML